MIPIVIGTVIGTVAAAVVVHYVKVCLRKIAKRDGAKAKRLGELDG